jgi:hypothetical protein
MTTAVDTSILLDILIDDPSFADAFLARDRGSYREFLAEL